MIRGGHFGSFPEDSTTTYRDEKVGATDFSPSIGFRLLIECPDARPSPVAR